jgi:hypothetical protein
MQSAYAVLCHLWPVRLPNIFPHYHTKNTISERNVLQKTCFDFLHKSCLKSSGSSSPLCLRILKEGIRVRQKHNCLGIVFIAAIVTTCFGRAWPSSSSTLEPHPHQTSPTQTVITHYFSKYSRFRPSYLPHRTNIQPFLSTRQQRTGPTCNCDFLNCARHQNCDLKMAKHGRNM